MNLKAEFQEKIRYYLCPLLLGMSVCYAVINMLYKAIAVPYSILFVVLGFFLFRLFDILKSKKIIGGLIYTALLIIVTVISFVMIFSATISSRKANLFRMWLYGAEGLEQWQFILLNAIFIGGGFFLISIIYYFTQAQYRTLGLMLCILFPFVISSKRLEAIDEKIILFILVMYIITVIHNQRIVQKNERAVLKIDRAYFVSIGVFVAVTVAIAMTIERPTYLAQLQKNPAYFDYNPNRVTINTTTSFENPSANSSENYGERNLSDTPLFYFQTDGGQSVYYLRRQAYSVFDGEIWKMAEYYNSSSTPYNGYAEYSTREILNDWQAVIQDNTEISTFVQRKNGTVYSQSFFPSYLPSPFGTVLDSSSTKYIRYPQGLILRKTTNNGRKSLLNDSFIFEEPTHALISYIQKSSLRAEEYCRILESNSSEEAKRLLDDYNNAKINYSDTQNISKNVLQLATQITEEYSSDMDKATALEKYFSENGYLYDENVNPDDKSIDYFIFTGKAGVCSSYATAMTLMARSIGLPSRYVEGFAGFEKSDTDTFVIRNKHSHAFVEVYISGVGWITFDPTVADYRKIEQDNGNDFLGIIWQIIDRYKYLIIVSILIFLLLKSDRLYEMIFRIRQLFRTPKQKTLSLYAHMISVVNFSTNDDYNSYTVDMLRKYLTSTREVVPEKLLTLFESTAFGGYQPTNEEYRTAYTEYKKCYRYLRKIPRKKRHFAKSPY